MAIVFNEEKYAEDIINNGIQFSSKKHYDLQLAATYLRMKGLNDAEIEKELHRISKMSFSDYNWVKFYEIVDAKVKKSKKYRLRKNPEIIITQAEIETISQEEERKIQNLMFVCLVLAKYYMSNNNTDKYYVKYSDVDIFNLCDAFVKKNERLELMHYLDTKGYITPTLNMNFIVHYVNEDSSEVLRFKPDTDMIYYFEQYLGGLFVNCENCGKLTKKTNNKVKYCKECAKIKKAEAQDRRYKVYVLTNTINGMQYVGRTSQSLNSRFQNGKGYVQSIIYGDIEKYGWDKFKQELIKDGLTKEESCQLEMELISKLDTIRNGYNISEGGLGKDCFTCSPGGYNRENEFTIKMEKKKRELNSNFVYYTRIKNDDNHIYYCIENDIYIKGLKSLCYFLRIDKKNIKKYILDMKPYFNKTFIMSNQEYDECELTDAMKEDIKNKYLQK
jgi:hypothetical protein|nr:MAG TPA: intron associated endonuclease [Caudoviricetes sp.]